MLIVQDAYAASDLPRGAVATIGNFDGVHRGQQTVIETVIERARALEVPSMAITFEPHPLSVLRPREAPPRITQARKKEELLESTGLDVLLVIHFTPELAAVEAGEFVESFLSERLAIGELHVGASFRFGKGRGGDLVLLREAGERSGFAAFGIEEVVEGGERISSTRIREALGRGDVEQARALLGRPHEIAGEVVHGDRMGKRLGWPTINLAPGENLLPADGVYACRVHFPSFPATFDCSTNIGTRPTVYENYQRVVESHILDFSTTVYGEQVALSLYKRLRGERIFPTVMDLAAQIGRDVESTREFFAARRGLASQVDGV